jgi:hypothetical protein
LELRQRAKKFNKIAESIRASAPDWITQLFPKACQTLEQSHSLDQSTLKRKRALQPDHKSTKRQCLVSNLVAVGISRFSEEGASTGNHPYTSEDSDASSPSAGCASSSTSQDTVPTDVSSLAGNSDSSNASVTCERQDEALGVDFLNQGQTLQSGLVMQESFNASLLTY